MHAYNTPNINKYAYQNTLHTDCGSIGCRGMFIFVLLGTDADGRMFFYKSNGGIKVIGVNRYCVILTIMDRQTDLHLSTVTSTLYYSLLGAHHKHHAQIGEYRQDDTHAAERHRRRRRIAAVGAAREDARSVLHHIALGRHVVAVVAQVLGRAEALRTDATCAHTEYNS